MSSWSKIAPKTKAARRALRQRCGSAAFLDAKNLKYPVMPAKGACQINCRGVRAALSRASQQHRRKLVKKAKRLSSRACSWR